MLGQRRWSSLSTAGSMERRRSWIPRWPPSKDPHCWPTTMRSSETRTGRVYRTCSAALRQKIPSKWENLELDSTPFTTSQVRILSYALIVWVMGSPFIHSSVEHRAKIFLFYFFATILSAVSLSLQLQCRLEIGNIATVKALIKAAL